MKSFAWKYQRDPKLALTCLVASLIAVVLISITGLSAGFIVIGSIVILSLILLTVNDYRHGFLALVVYAFFMFHVYRAMPNLPYFPVGTVIEIFLVLLSAAIIFKSRKADEGVGTFSRNPVSYMLIVYCVYSLILLLNPQSHATIGRILGLREIGAFLVLFFVTIHVFQKPSFIYFFTRFWLALAVTAALYGVYQEMFGLQEWELKWLYAQPDQGKLAMVWGHVRKWSFMSDINAFGLLMAYGGIICMILALGPLPSIQRILFASSALLMFVAMTFSGTRTAMLMVVCGLTFYVVMTLYQRKSMMLVILFSLGVAALFFGPFYGPNFNRLRSTFQISSDPSMNVRNTTRERMKPYVQRHAFGGGINTSGTLGLKFDPGHELAGDWDTDSGYLRTALERGWIGLLLQLALYSTIMIYGLSFFYKSQDPIAATYCCGYLCGFFALTIANYAQDSLEQKPINLIVMASVATIVTFSVTHKQQRNSQ